MISFTNEKLSFIRCSFCHIAAFLAICSRTSLVFTFCSRLPFKPRRCLPCGVFSFAHQFKVHTWRINEVAIAMAYALVSPFGQREPLKAASAMLRGYRATFTPGLLDKELKLVFSRLHEDYNPVVVPMFQLQEEFCQAALVLFLFS